MYMFDPPSTEKHSNTKTDFLDGKENAVESSPDISMGSVTSVSVIVCEPAPLVKMNFTVAYVFVEASSSLGQFVNAIVTLPDVVSVTTLPSFKSTVCDPVTEPKALLTDSSL